jgi:hypothetical protein
MSKWARVAGIATNGVDVWLVDNYSRKVFKYSNAASRTSGSQNAASSFSLNGANSNPTDIVTDGTHLWVVDNGLTDKVFKYTLQGSLASSWTIDPDNLNPRGITLDPANPDHLWIVDGNQRRIYEYAHAVDAANGSTCLASASFALDARNTHPEGIADPRPLLAPPPARQSADTSFPLGAGNTNLQGIADPPPGASRGAISAGDHALVIQSAVSTFDSPALPPTTGQHVHTAVTGQLRENPYCQYVDSAMNAFAAESLPRPFAQARYDERARRARSWTESQAVSDAGMLDLDGVFDLLARESNRVHVGSCRDSNA